MSIQKLQDALHAVPFLKHMEIIVDAAMPGHVTLTVAPSGMLNDHAGHLHSGALFVLGEAAAGIAVGTHPNLNALVTRQQASGIRYLQSCTNPAKATGEISPEMLEQIRGALKDGNEAKIEVVVPIRNSSEQVCAEVVSMFTFRQP